MEYVPAATSTASASTGRPSMASNRRPASRTSSTLRVLSFWHPAPLMRTSSFMLAPSGSLLGVLLAPGVQRVVNRESAGQTLLVAQFECMETLGDGLEPRRLRRSVFFTLDVGAMDDFCQVREGRLLQIEFADQHLERAQTVVVGELQLWIPRHVEWHRFFPGRDPQDLALRRKHELCLWVNEAPNQPGAGDSVHFHVVTRNPFHREAPLLNSRHSKVENQSSWGAASHLSRVANHKPRVTSQRLSLRRSIE